MMFLKWHNNIIGNIHNDGSVDLINPNLNGSVSIYTKGKNKWGVEDFKQFLEDRLISKSRRDIEKVLSRLSLNEYDIFKIAIKTRAINPKDLFWISLNESETIEEVIGGKLTDIFFKPLNESLDSVFSPDGVNVKYYGVHENKYGIYKESLHPYSSDIETELAVHKLANRLGVDSCPFYLISQDNKKSIGFSEFVFDFTKETLIHARHFFTEGERDGHDEYTNLKNKFPDLLDGIRRCILLDFITRQTDRHLSNLGVLLTSNGRKLYPLYDNGRALFYEDKTDFINVSLTDIEMYSSEFGSIGTYYDAVLDISKECSIEGLIDLTITKNEIYEIYVGSKIPEERLIGCVEWTYKCIEILRVLSNCK